MSINTFVLLICAVALGPLVWNQYKVSSAFVNGLSAKAVVTDVIDTGNRHNDNPVVVLKLRVQPPSGPAYDAEIRQPMSAVALIKLPRGQEVAVRVHRDHPERIALVPE